MFPLSHSQQANQNQTLANASWEWRKKPQCRSLLFSWWGSVLFRWMCCCLQHSQSSLQSSLFVYKHAVASHFCYNWTLPLAAVTYSSKDADRSCIEIPSQCWFVIKANETIIFLSDDLKWYVSLEDAQGESMINDDKPLNNLYVL